LFRNQETYAFLEPRQTISFSEYWMPVREIGGISRANLAGVVHLSRRADSLMTGLNVNQPVRGATLRISSGTQQMFEAKADLSPERTWSHELPNADPQHKYTFELRDANGAALLQQTEGQYDWTPVADIHVGPQASYRIPEADKRSEDDWIQVGNDQELNGRLLQALQTYQDALAKFPDSFEAHKAAGRLCASLLRFKEAKTYLEVVRARDTSDAEVSYYLGIAYEGLGEAHNAREAYEAAFRLPAFRAAAGLRLAELSAREGKQERAEFYLQDVMRVVPDDLRTAEELIAVLRAAGKTEPAVKLNQEWLGRFPQRYFLLEQAGKPDLHHLGDDAERVLNIAAEYMRLGLYSPALEVLSRDYPPAIPDESEPGALPPRQHPMVAYFRGYCREKLGQSGAADFSAASKLSTAYVFPGRADDIEVLTTALRANPQDASAHYLIGTFYLSRGLTDEALEHWGEARKFNPQIPVLHASMGRALLHVKNDPQQALTVFQEGLTNDATNVELYTGVDQSLSMLGRPARERVEALQRYPDRANMPSHLIYELILNLAEAGDYDAATALFHNRFFQRAEGGTNVRQVWIEVQLQRGLSLAQKGQCTEAISTAGHLGDEVPDLPFTHDGLEPLLHSGRISYLLGTLYTTCKQADKAESIFKHAAAQSELEDAVWAWKAAQELPGFEPDAAKQKLESVLQRTRSTSEISYRTGWWLFNAAMLDRALGHSQQAESEFRSALLFPDQMLTYHLTRLALSNTPQ
jgi:tetratricopeptide (TPR) repeat protein